MSNHASNPDQLMARALGVCWHSPTSDRWPCMTAATPPPPRDGEVCGARYPGSEGGYCPCIRTDCDGFHRCAHGDRWGSPRPAAPSEPPAADSPTPGTDREPQPGDGPDFHAEHAAWVTRQPPAEAQQDDELTEEQARHYGAGYVAGLASRPSADTEKLRALLRAALDAR